MIVFLYCLWNAASIYSWLRKKVEEKSWRDYDPDAPESDPFFDEQEIEANIDFKTVIMFCLLLLVTTIPDSILVGLLLTILQINGGVN